MANIHASHLINTRILQYRVRDIDSPSSAIRIACHVLLQSVRHSDGKNNVLKLTQNYSAFSQWTACNNGVLRNLKIVSHGPINAINTLTPSVLTRRSRSASH